MRIALIGLAVVTMSIPAAIEPAIAQPREWCLQGGRGSPGGGLPHCTFYTLEQCRASIGGGGEGCFRNPALLWDRIEGKRYPPRRKSRERGY